MTKIDIFSGFLGAGKTTLIKKLISTAYAGQNIVLIENEFGEIGIDGGFLQDAGIEIREMNSGCICCSLVGDFGDALKMVLEQYSPDRILIEPSGVGKLSDVIRAVQNVGSDELVLDGFVAVVDAKKCKTYMKNFGEFFNDQIEHAGTIIFSRTKDMDEEKLAATVELVRAHNANAVIITTDWDELDGNALTEAIERRDTLDALLEKLSHEELHEHHHHHHHDDDEHEHHHHDHDDDDDDEHEHHHHDHDDDDEHEHHHHDHDHEHHHHDHDADEVFTSWGKETAKKYTAEEIGEALSALDTGKYGSVLRAKGIVAGKDGSWIHFDFVPGEADIRTGSAAIIGRLCVIGSELDEDGIASLFRV